MKAELFGKESELLRKKVEMLERENAYLKASQKGDEVAKKLKREVKDMEERLREEK